MAITITLQAASDAVMTENNVFDGTTLADSDFRKVYGLSNQYVGNDNRIHIVKDVRWDSVTPPESAIKLDYTVSTPEVDAWTIYGEDEINDVTWSLNKQRKPTTTAFQLRCDSISHDVQDMSAISPMPAFNNQEGTRFDTATPGQMNNLVIAFGMRTEVIKLSGVLVDEGPITASNPRKQVLMNIARMQYLKTGRGGNNSWGGVNSGPLNPNSYLCLAIYDSDLGTSGTFDSIGYQPNGLDIVYRGLIKSLSFRQEGGRPNQWFWTMEFSVLANEHPQQLFSQQGLLAGTLEINRIRLVDSADLNTAIVGGDFPTTALIELRTANDLRILIGENPPKYQIPENFQVIMITSSDSNPKIDGRYTIDNVGGVSGTANTFTLKSVLTSDSVVNNVHVGNSGFNEPDITQTWSGFTNGNKAYVNFGADGGGKAALITQNFERPIAAWEYAVGDGDEDHTAAEGM